MAAVIVIPARYDSTRFPGKPLAPLRGKPLIQHVYENCCGAARAREVVVATDSERIAEAVRDFGGTAVMTSPEHQSGTDRVAEAVRSLGCDIIVNVQGDEPLIRPVMIDDVIDLLSDSSADIGTLVKKITDPAEILAPHVVKAVFRADGFALYFSRSPIPFCRDSWIFRQRGSAGSLEVGTPAFASPGQAWFKHIGIYGYRRDVLFKFTGLPPAPLEETERLEQLRALEHGFTIKVRETAFETIGVDTPEDLERVETWLSSSS